MRATAGAIEKVVWDEGGNDLRYETIGGNRPKGICGSGLIDILGTLLLNRVIDQQGRFFPEKAWRRLREREGGKEYIIAFKDETGLGENIAITQEDLLNVIRSKAAVYAAAMTVIHAMSLTVRDLKRVLVAGGFGTYLNIEKAVLIGLLPDLPLDRFRFVGNSSLKGARRTLLCGNYLHKALSISRAMTYLELSVYPGYMDEYMAAIFLPHTNMSDFPNVAKKIQTL